MRNVNSLRLEKHYLETLNTCVLICFLTTIWNQFHWQLKFMLIKKVYTFWVSSISKSKRSINWKHQLVPVFCGSALILLLLYYLIKLGLPTQSCIATTSHVVIRKRRRRRRKSRGMKKTINMLSSVLFLGFLKLICCL